MKWEELTMKVKLIRLALTVVLGAMTASLPSDLHAADKPAAKPPTGGSPVLPVPDPPFHGVIGRAAKDCKPDFAKAVTPPAGAPNVLLIMTDDTGYGAASTLGGLIPTPTLDRLAGTGLRYHAFHTTALC